MEEEDQTRDSYDFTIDHYEDGLRIKTHKNTRVTLEGTKLVIHDLGNIINNEASEEKSSRVKEHLIPCKYYNIRGIVFQGDATVNINLPPELLPLLLLNKGSLNMNSSVQFKSDNSVIKSATLCFKLSGCVKNSGAPLDFTANGSFKRNMLVDDKV